MENSPTNENTGIWLDRPVFSFLPKFTIEHLLITIILIVAIITRFYNLGARDMSHDEVNHVVPSYELYQGQGYRHDPVTHGPLKFHLVAATYFFFGDSDYSSRVPTAVFSVAAIAFILLAFKRYLGRIGALLAGLFYTISPFMLFYGRYLRDEAILTFFGVVIFFCVLRYLEKGKANILLLLSAMLSLSFCSEETAFIYTAILLLFLGVLFLRDVMQKEWQNHGSKEIFSIAAVLTLLLGAVALVAAAMEAKAVSTTQPFTNLFWQNLEPVYQATLFISLGLTAVAAVLALVALIRGVGWRVTKTLRSFDLMILIFTLVLPLLTAFPVKMIGWNPLDYSQTGLIHTSIVLVIITAIAVAIGIIWKPSLWFTSAGIFYAIFTVFYTTFFTNGEGFFTGIVGALGYWLSQQSVSRGTQPWYYYAFLQIPMYEYLGALGLILAIVYAFRHGLFFTLPGISPALQPNGEPPAEAEQLPLPAVEVTEDSEPVVNETSTTGMPETEVQPIQTDTPKRLPVLALLSFFSVLSLIAYSIAGEKMPWLTVYIAMPILLGAGWGIGYLIESIPWKDLANRKGFFAALLTPVFLVSLFMLLGILIGPNKPFAGMTLDQLQTTSTFAFSLVAAGLSGWGIVKLMAGWSGKNLLRLATAGIFLILSILTARSAYQASFINYDNAKEFLVYAHGAPGPKEILSQVQEISQRTVGGTNIKVAYLGDALYPYWWYFRDYPNKMWYKSDITKDLLNYPLVISDDTDLQKAESVLGDNYIRYDYIRLWWPMMDYTNLTFERVKNAVTNPKMLEALFNIWFNKDYTLYATLTNNPNLTLETWQPSAGLHFFIKKDIVNEIWDYGTVPATASAPKVDPYAGHYITLTPDVFFGQAGTGNGQFADAHGIAVAPDGTLYITDTNNNRIEHFTASGQFLNAWGTAGSVDSGNAPGGTFKEPWGIAIGPDGSVYVADTWNYRIQKFTADGKFVTMWGQAGQGDTPDAFWGPRGVAVDKNGHVYVTDTGNKRVVVFDANGNFITEFGSAGMDDGQFDENVGIAVDANGLVYVADTWNQRIQVFTPNVAGTAYTFTRSWDVDGWNSQSTENKPFIAVDSSGNVFVTDPSGFRVLEFTNGGQIIRVWGQYSSGIDGFGNPVGVAIDSAGRVWIMDSANNYALRFTMPVQTTISENNLPAIPTAQISLRYDAQTNQLVDQANKAFYQLDATGKIWVPIIPDSITQAFTEPLNPMQDQNGNWVLMTKEGTMVYQWNTQTLTWTLLSPIGATVTK